MFAYLFASLVQIAIFVGVGVLLYQVFLSDWIQAKRQAVQDSKNKHDSLEKIAQVKLISDSPGDIETFITVNAQYLSDDMVKRLVARIEAIKNDDVINADTLLKTRIEELDKNRKEALEILDEPAVVKQASQGK